MHTHIYACIEIHSSPIILQDLVDEVNRKYEARRGNKVGFEKPWFLNQKPWGNKVHHFIACISVIIMYASGQFLSGYLILILQGDVQNDIVMIWLATTFL